MRQDFGGGIIYFLLVGPGRFSGCNALLLFQGLFGKKAEIGMARIDHLSCLHDFKIKIYNEHVACL